MHRSIYIYCDGGFGNRFNSLVSGLLIAEKSHLEPVVIWPVNNWCGARYDDLIEYPAQVQVYDYELAEFLNKGIDMAYLMTEDHLGKGVDFVSPMHIETWDSAHEYINSNQYSIFYYTPLVPPFIAFHELAKTIASIKFCKYSMDRFNHFMSSNNLIDYFGIHIRKTDFGVYGVSEKEILEQITNSPDKIFFVCSDQKSVEDFFRKLPNVVTYPKHSYVEKRIEGEWTDPTFDFSGRLYASNINRSAESVLDALVDLLILSKSNIIKTSNSTFLNTAFFIQLANSLCEDQPFHFPDDYPDINIAV